MSILEKPGKRVSVQTLDRELWKIFSIYIRLRDASASGLCRCVTCSTVGPWTWFDAGHFIQRDNLAVKYDEENVNAQCGVCNRLEGGMASAYRLALDRKWGPDTAARLREKAGNKLIRLERSFYLEKIPHYKAEITRLKRIKIY